MTPPFTLPLTPEAFTDALHKGLGRAMQHARTCGLAGLEQTVIDACLHNHAYDPQIEGRRSDWLMKMIYVANAQDRIARELLPHLNDPCDIHWDLVHRSRIALDLALHGFTPAREIVYALLRKSTNTNDVTGYEEVITLDGAKGLIYVADFMGKLVQQDGYWADDHAIKCFDEIGGKGAGRQILDEAAHCSPSIGHFLKHIDERAAEQKSKETQASEPTSSKSRLDWLSEQSAQATISEIRQPDVRFGRFMFTEWGKRVAPEELVPVFDAMLLETDIKRLDRYLRVFAKASLPAFNPSLLRFADHPEASVRQQANVAISNYSHPDVRAFALARISEGRFADREICLFPNNFCPGDAARIEQQFNLPLDVHDAHRTLNDLIDLFQKHPLPESRKLMLFTYNHTPCSYCRCDAIEILLKTQQVPTWLIDECRDDSAKSIRDLFPSAA